MRPHHICKWIAKKKKIKSHDNRYTDNKDTPPAAQDSGVKRRDRATRRARKAVSGASCVHARAILTHNNLADAFPKAPNYVQTHTALTEALQCLTILGTIITAHVYVVVHFPNVRMKRPILSAPHTYTRVRATAQHRARTHSITAGSAFTQEASKVSSATPRGAFKRVLQRAIHNLFSPKTPTRACAPRHASLNARADAIHFTHTHVFGLAPTLCRDPSL